jgi:methyl-accepting chemotaxis protein
MRNNGPVTQHQISIPEHYILSTGTNVQGTILSASEDFLKISGYRREEMIGQPHNLLRHPDVPPAVFADMWQTLKAGKSWTGIVKNRAKNGDFYWVQANASPIEENGQVVGYISVRTPASVEQIAEAERLYAEVAQGRVVLRDGVALTKAQARWQGLTLKGGLSVTLLVYSALILLVGLSLLGAVFYQAQIAPIVEHELAREVAQAQTDIRAPIASKAMSAADIAATAAMMPEIKQALAGLVPRAVAEQRLAEVQAHFAKITDYKNIRFQLYDRERRSFMRSWALAEFGDSHVDRIRDRAFDEKRVIGDLSIHKNGFGVGATGYAPVFEGGQLVGVISASGGVGSIVRELKSAGMDWVMVIDQRFYGDKMPPTLAKNTPFRSGYVLAHNRWFDEKAVAFLSAQMPALLQGEAAQAYFVGEQILIDIPAYNPVGEVIGRHLIVKSAQAIHDQIAQARQQVVLSLLGVVAVVVAIMLILLGLINTRVISPLKRLSASMSNMVKTGRFNDRVVRLDNGDEISQIVNAYNQFAGNVQRAITNVNDVMSSVAQGQFNVAVTDSLQGDLAVMKDAVNGSVLSVRDTMQALEVVMEALYHGDFSARMPDSIKGEFREKVDQAVAALKLTIDDVNGVMNYMSEGKFQHRIQSEARGDLLQLKQTVNQSMDALESAIKEITEVNVAMSQGDLTHLIHGDYHGELRLLKEAVNSSIMRLEGIVSVAVEATRVVEGASAEVSHGSHDLSDRVQRQAAAIEQTSATMDEMNSTIQHNTQNANQAAELASNVQTQIVQGSQVMTQTIEAMAEIQKSSHKIADIVTLIDSIAFQTNLLALNAAVEAARAGDHGRGFAVVAGEVRSLAQKSADAARDIKALIEESVTRIDQGTKLAGESGQVLNGITDSIHQVTDMVNQIAKASNEQAAGIHQVHGAINNIDQMTQQNAALVEETTAASESMSEQAKNLAQEMAFFKTHGTAAQAQKMLAPKRPAAKTPPIKTKPALANKGDDWAEF